MIDKKQSLFLLGGQDLEMVTIRKVLEKEGVEFHDKNLSWGAKLSDYQAFLDFEGMIYGVELEADITPPKNYIEIDHHGNNDEKPSSLEQVSNILGIELDDEQILIAANDSRYISGMKSLCVTQEKIDEIRAKDRKAQGITLEDEALAKTSFEACCESETNCIYSQTPKFSAVSDLAYYKFDNYIIYDDTKIVFYRYKKEIILEFLKSHNINEAAYYYGGGDFGFVGIKENVLDKTKIEKLVEEFKKVENQDELYSYHTFMLPFTFNGDFTPKNGDWEDKPFEIKKQQDYNEYIYFYKHVQDAIFNDKEKEKWISKYYEYKNQKGTYTINCIKGVFELELDGLSLRIFSTNVAILSFNLKNTKYNSVDDILAINDFGRRIYPQFLGDNFTCDTKQAILANCITLTFEDEKPITENFQTFDSLDKFNGEKLKDLQLLPQFIRLLIEPSFEKTEKIRPIIDDRMFVISQYNNDALVKSLSNYKECNAYEYETNDFWYKYLFVDGNGKTCQSKHMTKKLLAESSYDRWIEWGTLFGISRYSFVSITGSWYGKKILLPHTQTMYFQMFTLLLAYRATIIKFADDIQDATSQDDAKLPNKAKEIYKKYLAFLNKLYFKEVTAQDQGVELYSQAMKIMNIEKYMADLDTEINELHNYANIIEEEKRTKSMNRLSMLGSYLLLPSLVVGFFGMNISEFEGIKNQFSWIVLVGFVVLSALVVPIILNRFNKQRKETSEQL
jgi:hypothetical protein